MESQLASGELHRSPRRTSKAMEPKKTTTRFVEATEFNRLPCSIRVTFRVVTKEEHSVVAGEWSDLSRAGHDRERYRLPFIAIVDRLVSWQWFDTDGEKIETPEITVANIMQSANAIRTLLLNTVYSQIPASPARGSRPQDRVTPKSHHNTIPLPLE